MKIEITSTEAVRNFGDCLARIKHRGDSFVITRNRRAVAELSPISASSDGRLSDLLASWRPDTDDPGFADDLEAANSREMPERTPWDT